MTSLSAIRLLWPYWLERWCKVTNYFAIIIHKRKTLTKIEEDEPWLSMRSLPLPGRQHTSRSLQALGSDNIVVFLTI